MNIVMLCYVMVSLRVLLSEAKDNFPLVDNKWTKLNLIVTEKKCFEVNVLLLNYDHKNMK